MQKVFRRQSRFTSAGQGVRQGSGDALSTQLAEAIAEAAQSLGQEDDITVPSITRKLDLNSVLA